MLVDGTWREGWTPKDAADGGAFNRKPSAFRHWITPDGRPGPSGTGGFAAEAGRYHLFAALICPWACRTLMARRLKGLEGVIGVSIVSPVLTPEGWGFDPFPGATAEPLFGSRRLHELYSRADPHYTGRATVPLLWDRKTGTAVNNESADIVRMFDDSFATLVPDAPVLRPPDLAEAMDALQDDMYRRLNNGVYRAGFATAQDDYERAVRDVFAMLDTLEKRLAGGGPFLFGARLTEADLRLFVTLIRFDAAYHGAFKCNLRQIADYPALQGFLRHMLGVDGIAGTVDLAHIKAGYYSIRAINPTGIVPLGPRLDLPLRAADGS